MSKQKIQIPTEEEIWKFLLKKKDRRSQIANEFQNFGDEIIPELITAWNDSCGKKENIYQLCDAKLLSGANAVTRKFSTKLGLLMEKIADLAPNVVSPEHDFYGKVPEVDVVVAYNEHLYWTQMKNQRNTLTGSQKPRTKAGLEKFPYHWFAVSIDTNTSLTFNEPYVIIGCDYWEKLGFDYEQDIVGNLKKLINRVENAILQSM